MTHKPAGFFIRLLAELIEVLLWALIFSLIILVLSDSQTLAQLFYGLVLYLITLSLPLGIINIFYKPIFTHYFGGNIGKLVTGLRVTNMQNHLLTFKQALFRYTIGYTFSAVLFGLGFFSIITDKEKRAFHDKTIGSKVVISRNIWPLGLVILIALMVVHFMFWGNSLQKLNNGPLKSEFGFLMLNFSQDISKPEPTPSPEPSAEPTLQNI